MQRTARAEPSVRCLMGGQKGKAPPVAKSGGSIAKKKPEAKGGVDAAAKPRKAKAPKGGSGGNTDADDAALMTALIGCAGSGGKEALRQLPQADVDMELVAALAAEACPTNEGDTRYVACPSCRGQAPGADLALRGTMCSHRH